MRPTAFPPVLPFERVYSVRGGTPLGFRLICPPTQGSSFLATLGWRAQSRWDCRLLNGFGWCAAANAAREVEITFGNYSIHNVKSATGEGADGDTRGGHGVLRSVDHARAAFQDL